MTHSCMYDAFLYVTMAHSKYILRHRLWRWRILILICEYGSLLHVTLTHSYIQLRLIFTCDWSIFFPIMYDCDLFLHVTKAYFNMRRCRCHILLRDYDWFLTVTLTHRFQALILMWVWSLFKLPTWLRLVDFKLWYSCLYEEYLSYSCV